METTIRLGVNVDHVATLRQARRVRYPDPVQAAALAELAGADQITVHLREDRRHIQDRDLRLLRETVQTRLNLEMAATEEMLAIALEVRPDTVTFVPERREELTTEGGLDVAAHFKSLERQTARLKEVGIEVSLFIDPVAAQIDAARDVGATVVELHTGAYCEAGGAEALALECSRLEEAARHAHRRGLEVAAGHGLTYENVGAVAAIPEVVELNIGHSIVARAVLVGFERAVRDMRERMAAGRSRVGASAGGRGAR
ncbi:MAG: pyridoxine 5'-phosphate synthase [Deltaproteobacteria bacterium]|nr:MAG: pyridoxine 5'-phosphate synthase [Deltaproteobacteria bacterium]